MIEGALLVALFGLLLVTAVAMAVVRPPIVSVITFAAYSLAMTLVWVRYRAPDVALTEAAVGAGVTTVLFLLVLAKTTSDDATDAGSGGVTGYIAPIRWPAALVATAFGGAVLVTVPSLPAIGAVETPVHQYLGVQYLTAAPAETGVSNVVTAILAGYRGFDTFAETVVVFISGIAVLLVLRQEGVR